jgi:MotA/TolQ/ExbB proton channel family
MNRWLISGVWLAALLAIVSASTQNAIGIAAMWALPAALAATMAGMGWPDKPMAKIVGGVALVWQLALFFAYWPFASKDPVPSAMGPMTWPAHALVILAVLALLAMAFVAMFVLPALALRKKVHQASLAVAGDPNELMERVGEVLEPDEGLAPLWREYQAHLRPASADPDAGDDAVLPSSSVSARAVFDLPTVTSARLRLDLFRNLPGVCTGIGIIGTFGGLIMGLRTFRISQDPAVVQKSLELLMSGVWEAFLVSAVAITLAIAVTLVEKIVMSLVTRRLDAFAMALDNAYPPRPQPTGEDWLPRMVAALNALQPTDAKVASAREDERDGALARSVLTSGGAAVNAATVADTQATGLSTVPEMPAMRPMAPAVGFTAAHPPAPVAPLLASQDAAAMVSLAQQTQAAVLAMTDLATNLPHTLADSLHSAGQSQAQAVQSMKVLSARLEGVASSIESSGRRTMETVAQRMLQSEANMVMRHQAVAEHLGDVVQRIEALCGLLQQNGGHEQPQDGFGFDAPNYDASAFVPPGAYANQQRQAQGGAYADAPPRHRNNGRQPNLEYEDGNEYDDGGYPAPRDSDGRYDRGDGGSFGS